MFSRLLMCGVNHRLIVLLLLTAVTAAAVAGLPRLEVDTGFGGLVADDDPDRPVYERIVAEFGSDSRTVVYVRDPQLWSPTKLAALEALHDDLAGLGIVTRVQDLFTLHSVSGTAGRVAVDRLMPAAPADAAAAARIRQKALADPLVVGNFLAPDGLATVLLVSVADSAAGRVPGGRVDSVLETVLAPARATLQEVFQVGPPRINAELNAVLMQDLRLLGPLSAAVLVAVMLVLLRSALAALIPLVTSALSIVWTFGALGWSGTPLNILSAMLPSLVVVIGSTEDTHMIAAYLQGIAARQRPQRRQAARFMLSHLGVPLLLTLLTTALGFASNVVSDITIIRHFALSATLAIAANGVITILLVPLMLSVVGPRRTRLFDGRSPVGGVPGVFVRAFGLANRRFPRLALAATALLCAFFVFQLSKITVTNDPLSYFRPDQPLVRDIAQIHRDLAGIKTFFVALSAERDKAFQDPRNLERLAAIQRFMDKQGIFDRSVSLADQLALVNRAFHGGDPESFRVPPQRELAAQYLLFFHRSDLASYVSPDFRRAAIVVRHKVSDSNTLNRHIRELRQVAADIAGSDITVHVVGENLMINAAAEHLMLGQIESLAILLSVIFLLMSAMFTSFKGGLVALIPNLIPIVLMFGLMGLLEIPFNPGTAMVAVIAIGIAIDGTIHLLSRYNDLCRRTADYPQAVHATVTAEATPMVTTGLALALGFGVLQFSHFSLIAQFGALSAATMLFALFANLLVTPIIMARMRLVGLHQIVALKMHREVLQQSPLFQDMTPYQIRKAILISQLREFDTGDLLVQQGTSGRSMYLILSGEVEVVRHGGPRPKRIARLSAGQVFGEIGYVKKIRRTADVRALSPVEALCFDYRKLKKDLKFFPHIVANLNFNISCILGERLADVLRAMAPLTKNTSATRRPPST